MLLEVAAGTRFGVVPAGVTLALHRLGLALGGTAMAAAGRKQAKRGKRADTAALGKHSGADADPPADGRDCPLLTNK